MPVCSCRDGIRDTKKQNSTDGRSSKPKAIQQSSAGSNPKKAKPRIDRRMQELETLHNRNNVGNNLQLSRGKLRPDNKPKVNIVPSFDIELSDIEDDDEVEVIEPLKNGRYDNVLQEPSDTLKAPTRIPSPETNYSASDIDSFFNDMPLTPPDLEQSRSRPTKTSGKLSPTPQTLKRGQESHDTSYGTKRARFGDVKEGSLSPQVCLVDLMTSG